MDYLESLNICETIELCFFFYKYGQFRKKILLSLFAVFTFDDVDVHFTFRRYSILLYLMHVHSCPSNIFSYLRMGIGLNFILLLLMLTVLLTRVTRRTQ